MRIVVHDVAVNMSIIIINDICKCYDIKLYFEDVVIVEIFEICLLYVSTYL